jgi:dethiobiotin synthetase
MEKGYFITGTDTNVGKTWATVALMHYFKGQGKSVIGLKPVASGCYVKDQVLVNADALLLQENATVKLDYGLINPYAYELPVSPHIAGKDNPVDFNQIIKSFESIKDLAQVIMIEGAGGWYSPLNTLQDNSDLAKVLGLPVILVIAIKLGCINHAKLTHQAIKNCGTRYAGWVAVCSQPDLPCADETVCTLKKMLDAPLLGILPYSEPPDFNVLANSYCFVQCIESPIDF